MQDAVGDMVIADHVEHLGFVYVAGIGLGMQDPVGVKGEGLAVAGLGPRPPPAAVTAQSGQAAEVLLLPLVEPVFQGQQFRDFILISIHGAQGGVEITDG